jgi:hypothetical protein
MRRTIGGRAGHAACQLAQAADLAFIRVADGSAALIFFSTAGAIWPDFVLNIRGFA